MYKKKYKSVAYRFVDTEEKNEENKDIYSAITASFAARMIKTNAIIFLSIVNIVFAYG
jgi:hypothetical protein